MSMQIVECVPNFSEGRDPVVLNAISEVIKSVKGVKLLDIDPGEATNRTVVTIAGEPESVVEAAFRAIKKASELIDMRHHKGEHPRMGATDVCPFVPVSNITMEECAELAKKLGKRVGEELGIPVFLYEHAASAEYRQSLAEIRKGEYEAFAAGKMDDPKWYPDFGPKKFNEKTGATVIGARQFLVAYNINLNTNNVQVAKEIAFTIRENGRLKRDAEGNKVYDKNGEALRVPGKFKHCRALGWLIPEYHCAQITMNLTDYTVTSIQEVFDTCCEEAEKYGVRVTGSEIVGLLPKQAMIDAGIYYLKKQKASLGRSEEQIIQTAIQSLGLNDVAPFEVDKKIVEYQFQEKGKLVSMDLEAFTQELASDSPAPGGGSIAALNGALSAALSAMVANLTYYKKGYEDQQKMMSELGNKAHEIIRKQLQAIDKDTDAFNEVMAAFGMPKKTDEDKASRNEAIQAATKLATRVPLSVLEASITGLELALKAAQKGNVNSLSDAGVAGLTGYTAAMGAYYNVLINLPGIEDEKWVHSIRQKADKYIEQAKILGANIETLLLERLG